MKRFDIAPCEDNCFTSGNFIIGTVKELKKVYSDMVLDYYNAISDYKPHQSYQSVDMSSAYQGSNDFAILTITSEGGCYNTFRIVRANTFMRYLCNDWVKPA